MDGKEKWKEHLALMNRETLTFCVQAAQKGDRQALEQLLLYAYGIVDYQCKKLLPTQQSADQMTVIALKTVVSKLNTLENPEDFFAWLGRLTAVRCMRVRATLLEKGQTGENNAPVNFSFPSMNLSRAETAKVAEMLTDLLEPEERLSLYLYSLGALTPKAIGQLTGVPEETVQAQIQSAQTAVLKQMKLYADQGVTFTQANSLPALLRTRMLLNPAPEKAQVVVYSILPQQAGRRGAAAPKQPAPQAAAKSAGRSAAPQPEPQQKSQAGLIRVLAIIAGLLGVVLVISLTVLFSKLKKNQASAMVSPAAVVQMYVGESPEIPIL